MKIAEPDVELKVRQYLEHVYPTKKGWRYTKDTEKPKKRGQHGVDIDYYNPKQGRRIVIECKGWGGGKAQDHNNFNSALGQLLSRYPRSASKSYRCGHSYYILAVPPEFGEFIKDKVRPDKKNPKKKPGMGAGWKILGENLPGFEIWEVNVSSSKIKKAVTKRRWKEYL